ncbi:hypothetical protein, partial [Xanthovirga aplysinae]|uniref:hypothetical protein n=1 Tax=Xanthovirga aplysinae TaxID=2529853 RepID=UPI0012BD2DEB
MKYFFLIFLSGFFFQNKGKKLIADGSAQIEIFSDSVRCDNTLLLSCTYPVISLSQSSPAGKINLMILQKYINDWCLDEDCTSLEEVFYEVAKQFKDCCNGHCVYYSGGFKTTYNKNGLLSLLLYTESRRINWDRITFNLETGDRVDYQFFLTEIGEKALIDRIDLFLHDKIQKELKEIRANGFEEEESLIREIDPDAYHFTRTWLNTFYFTEEKNVGGVRWHYYNRKLEELDGGSKYLDVFFSFEELDPYLKA